MTALDLFCLSISIGFVLTSMLLACYDPPPLQARKFMDRIRDLE